MSILDDLERLEQAATAGPWRIAQWVGRRVIEPTRARYPHTQYVFTVGGVIDQVGGSFEANAELVCAARNALPALLAELRRLRRVEAAAQELVGAAADPRCYDLDEESYTLDRVFVEPLLAALEAHP